MRLLATQFENERQDKDFDSNIRILLHAQAIKNISQNRTFNLRISSTQAVDENSEPSSIHFTSNRSGHDEARRQTFRLCRNYKATSYLNTISKFKGDMLEQSSNPRPEEERSLHWTSVENVKHYMNIQNVRSARNLEDNLDSAAAVPISPQKRNSTRDTVETVSRYMSFQTVSNASTTE